MKNRITALISILAVYAVIITGTFAWANFSQSAVNEWRDSAEPGGTTHDDFDDPVKHIYIENWGTSALFVRIRLDEYMETGEGAGRYIKNEDGTRARDPENQALPMYPGTLIYDKETWITHIPGGQPENCGKGFHDYWRWEMGGWKYYMPAPDDLKKENGYVDQNTGVFGEFTPGVKKTQDSTDKVLTMGQWLGLNAPVGPYWVIDADGWAYWAAPLEPGTATGLLLESVRLTDEPDDSYYYAINVTAQMATKKGAQNYTDFFGNPEDKNYSATDDGKYLLNKIAGYGPDA